MLEVVEQIKVILLGDAGVGKTCLINKWTANEVNPNAEPTVGGSCTTKVDTIDGKMHSFQIWDVAGSETYRTLVPMYTRSARAAMIVYDVTNRESFENVPVWADFLKSNGKIPFVIVGNKIDLHTPTDDEEKDAWSMALEMDSTLSLTSSWTGDGVNDAFRALEGLALEKCKVEQDAPSVDLTGKQQGPKQCC